MSLELKINYEQVAFELTQEVSRLTMNNAVLKTAVNTLTEELEILKTQGSKEEQTA